jgi:hypothetical protein
VTQSKGGGRETFRERYLERETKPINKVRERDVYRKSKPRNKERETFKERERERDLLINL